MLSVRGGNELHVFAANHREVHASGDMIVQTAHPLKRDGREELELTLRSLMRQQRKPARKFRYVEQNSNRFAESLSRKCDLLRLPRERIYRLETGRRFLQSFARRLEIGHRRRKCRTAF